MISSNRLVAQGEKGVRCTIAAIVADPERPLMASNKILVDPTSQLENRMETSLSTDCTLTTDVAQARGLNTFYVAQYMRAVPSTPAAYTTMH